MVGVVLYVAGFLCGALLLWRIPSPHDGSHSGRARSLAVVVPARNEERRIGGLLASLPGQLTGRDEAVVVDDGSIDRTGTIVAAAGLRVAPSPPLPSNWLGKPHACATGAALTAAERLVFVDADVELRDGALEWLRMQPSAVTTVQPFHEVRRPYERLSLFPNVVALMGSGGCTPLGRRVPLRVAFGPVLAIDRDRYDAVGGHATVRDRFDEDAGLAALIGDVTLVAGRAAPATFRMYPEGFRSLIEGWTRILRPGLRAAPWWASLGVAAWITSLAGGWAVHPALYLVSAAQVWWAGRRVGRFGPLTALLYAIPLVVFVGLVVRSLMIRHPGWRGRQPGRPSV
jgi:4,4'-diaponeurosporenoate glycosyltransferase